MRKLGGMLMAVLLLTGCAAATPTATVPKSAEPTVEPTNDALTFCDTLVKELPNYASFVLDAAGGSVDAAEAQRLIDWADRVESQAPRDAVGVTALLGPLRTIEEVINAGGGDLTLTTTDYKAANLALLEYCSAAKTAAG